MLSINGSARMQVWAPLAKQVELLCKGNRHLMLAGEKGYWYLEEVVCQHGDDYAFFLDELGPFKDPRSPWQPAGVFGLSRHVNHDLFDWQHTSFRAPPLSSAIIYELHVGTFTETATFDAVIDHLDHLCSLGVTHLELMPVTSFSGEHGWGYDGVDLFAPHEPYGGPDGLKRLIDACHGKGLAVILDVVYNHLGPAGNLLTKFGPYFNTRYHTPWGEAINLDGAHSSEVRRFICDNALMWLRDYRLDGLRIDAIHALFDQSAVHLLEQLSEEVEELEASVGRPFVLIAESDLNDPKVVLSRDAGGFGMDAQWSDDFHHALHALLTGESDGYYEDFGTMAHLAKAISDVFVYDGGYSHHRKSFHGKSVSRQPYTRFLAYGQNHDQIGNRCKGERISVLAGLARAKVSAALVLTSPCVPMLFQGEEWGATTPFQYFSSHEDAELAHAVRQGRRREFSAFGWKIDEIPDPQADETFTNSKLRWSEKESQDGAAMLAWYQHLIALRRQTKGLSLAKPRVRFDEKLKWLVSSLPSLTIATNIGSSTVEIVLKDNELGEKQMRLKSHSDIRMVGATLYLPQDSVVILA